MMDFLWLLLLLLICRLFMSLGIHPHVPNPDRYPFPRPLPRRYCCCWLGYHFPPMAARIRLSYCHCSLMCATSSSENAIFLVGVLSSTYSWSLSHLAMRSFDSLSISLALANPKIANLASFSLIANSCCMSSLS